MMKKTALILGVATLGGYLVKRHLDKKIATEYYDGYVDAALCEGATLLGRGAVNGFNKFLEATERWFDEPAFGDSLRETINNAILSARKKQCPHLGDSRLCPTLFRKEQFGLAKVSRMQNVAELDMFKISSENNKWEEFQNSPLEREMDALTDFINNLYDLESLCYKAHKSLIKIAEQIKSLGFSGDSLGKFGFYFVSDSKYDLSEYCEFADNQAKLMTKQMQKICEILEQKSAWLDEICESYGRADLSAKESQSKVDSHKSSNNIDSNESSGESNAKSTKDLSTQTKDEIKDEIIAFIAQMQQIHTLITENFVENDKWRESKCVEAEQILQSFGESSKSSDSDSHESDLSESNADSSKAK